MITITIIIIISVLVVVVVAVVVSGVRVRDNGFDNFPHKHAKFVSEIT